MKINQVVWIISQETKAIIPAKIVEKITKETASGEQFLYVVVLPDKKQITLSEKDLFYSTIEQAKSYLVETAVKFIDEVVKRAVSIATKNKMLDAANDISMQDFHVNDIIEQANGQIEQSTQNEQSVTITLPDGQTARIGKLSLPEGL